MRKILTMVVLLVFCFGYAAGYGQPKPHGMQSEERFNIHNGNRIQTTFSNAGLVGRRVAFDLIDIGGEWPKGTGQNHEQIGDQLMMVGAEIIDRNGELKHSVVTPRGPIAGGRTGDKSPDGVYYTWEALPGYASHDTTLVAMSHQPFSWPAFWPDKLNVPDDPGWRNDAEDGDANRAAWNGYFGKNVFNADQESYFIMDDYNDARYAFYPDSTDSTRRGLGLYASSRGFQWSQVLAQDVLFFIYDITNIGTTAYDKVVFGLICGYMVGGDGGDDSADFIRSDNLTYSWDYDNIGTGGWSPVPVAGCAFLESPGNPNDGIDNDGDGAMGSGPTITESMFQPKTLVAGQQVVKIDYSTYKREVITMPGDQLTVIGPKGNQVIFKPGQQVEEVRFNGFDDNLNGLIDENNYSEVEIAKGVIQRNYVYVGYKYKDYITGEGLDNLLIDERRDDGIDNDGDWDPANDDVGLDGLAATMDTGENDGLPTSGRGTDAPGEPHIDKTDISESDQLGLTSFYYFYPYDKFSLNQDEVIWGYMQPGYFNATAQKVDGDWIYASGYFPLKPGETERISAAIIFAEDLPGDHKTKILDTKRTVQTIYDENYNFAKAPTMPTVWATAGDGEVTIYWDDKAELSYDVISGYDFEGYQLFRASDPAFEDTKPITDRFGSRIMNTPLKQWDKIDGIKGFYPESFNGAAFYLGDDGGLAHSYRDTTVQNGYNYYYAVVAYDHGDPVDEIQPAFNIPDITVDASGTAHLGRNVVSVRPEAKAAGYIQRDLLSLATPMPGTYGTGTVSVEIVDEGQVPDNHLFEVHFKDTATDGIDNDGDWKAATDDVGADGKAGTGDAGELDGKPTPGEPNVDYNDEQEWAPITSQYSVFDITDQAHPDTVVNADFFITTANKEGTLDTLADRTKDTDGGRDFFDGMRLNLQNDMTIARRVQESNWNILRTIPQNYLYSFTPFTAVNVYEKGVVYPVDISIACLDDFDGQSSAITLHRSNPNGSMGAAIALPAVKTNFKLIDNYTKQEMPYAFIDYSLRPKGIEPGQLSNQDQLILYQTVGSAIKITWKVLIFGTDSSSYHPKMGDTLRIVTTRPFGSNDRFQFTSRAAQVDNNLARASLNNIKVVPNPYVAAAGWEPRNPYGTGRGPRELHFTHLPTKCTIRIYTVQGELVNTLEHNSTFNDGTATWDMLTKDNLDIAYGVYVYHIEAPGIGQHVGKFAVIK